MDPPTTRSLSHSLRLKNLYLFLRVVKVGSAIIAGFEVCWLVWHHNNHYCTFYPEQCTSYQKKFAEVPQEHIWMIIACIITFLEACLTTSYFISSQTVRIYRTALFSSSLPTFIFLHVFQKFWGKQSFAAFHCFFFPRLSYIMRVEEKQCISVQCALVAAGISLAFSFAVLIMSGTIAGIEKWKEDNWTVLADWTVVRQGPQVVVSDEKSEGTTPGQV